MNRMRYFIFSLIALLISFGILVAGFMLIEKRVRAEGFLPGTMDPAFQPWDALVDTRRFIADENGITSLNPESDHNTVLGPVNAQGFRADFDFDEFSIQRESRNRQKAVVMVIGDSYTEGCCSDPRSENFFELLNRDSSKCWLNFGIGATDLTQYRHIAQYWVPRIQPDLVLVCPYMGNDIEYQHYYPQAGIPKMFTPDNNVWMQSIGADYLMHAWGSEQLKSIGEAYQFYLFSYTLFSDSASWYEKWIARSAALSRIYLNARDQRRKERFLAETGGKQSDPLQISKNLIDSTHIHCRDYETDLVFAPIPSHTDVASARPMQEIYGEYFANVPVAWLDISAFSTTDYDSPPPLSHWINSGHRKYADWLLPMVDSLLEIQSMDRGRGDGS